MRPIAMAIGGWWRVGIAILGLAGLGSGGVAVFVTSLEAGPVALLAVGLIFILIAVGGRLPSRLKVGENEAAWEGVEQFVKEVAQDVPTEQAPDLMNALTDLAEVAPIAAAAGLSVMSARSSYERLVTSMLLRAVDEINRDMLARELKWTPLSLRIETSGGMQQTKSDAVLTSQNNALFIEVKYLSGNFPTVLVQQTAEKLRRYARSTHSLASGALIISNQELTPAALQVCDALSEQDSINSFKYVQFNTEHDFPILTDAIRAAFGLPKLS